MNDLKLAYDTLKGKATILKPYFDYYEGKHPLVYSAARLRTVFRSLNANFSENWCSVVVNVPWERLVLERLEVPDDEAATSKLAELWARLDLALDADEVHKAALITGESYSLAWEEEEDATRATAFYHDPRACTVFYEDENPRQARLGAKWWRDEEHGRYRLNLYYPDRLVHYATPPMQHPPDSAASFELLDEQAHGYGVVPLFRFTTGQGSVLENAIPIQAAINKLLSDEMVTAEFGAFPQRWVISQTDPGNFKNAPNEIWMLPSGDGSGQPTQAGQFPAANLTVYETAVERRIAALSSITRIPSHYFFRQGGQPPSGEALVALEAPLNKMIDRIIQRMTITWQQMAAFMLRVEGVTVDPDAITVTYADPETVQPRTRAEIRQMNVAAGMPLVTALRRDGWTQKELEQLEQDRLQEQDQRLAESNLGGALLERFERGF